MADDRVPGATGPGPVPGGADRASPRVADHQETVSRRQRRLTLVLGLNLAIVAGQAVVGVLANSIGLLADAGHSLTDVAAVGLSLYAVRLARRPATTHRSFGFHRSTVLAAQGNAAALLVVTLVIGFFGVRGLLHPPDVAGGWVLAAAVVGAVVNGAAAWMLGQGQHGQDLNLRSAALHMTADSATSAGVALSAGVILLTGGFHWLDPAVSLVIAALIARQALRLVGETTDVLLESTPPGLAVDELVEAIVGVDSVDGVHDVHAWSLSPDVRAVSAHLVLSGRPTLAEAQAVARAAKAVVAERFGIVHATFELECVDCADAETDPCGIRALTSRHGPARR